MGGGLSRHELAAAVSEAGGLGTIAVNGADAIDRELSAARKLTGRPLAVNLLLPFARRDWFEAAVGRRCRRHLLGHAEAPHRGHLAPPVRLRRRGPRRPGRRRRRGDRPGRRGGRARPRHRSRPWSCSSGCARRCPRATRCCSPAGSPSRPMSRAPWKRAPRARSPAPASCSPRRAAPTRLPGAVARGRLDRPHRALRRRLAGAAPCRPQRRDRASPGPQGPARTAAEPRAQPPHRRPRRPLHARLGPGPDRPRPAPREPPALTARPDRRRATHSRRRGPALRGETVARIDSVRPAAELVAELTP